MKITYSETNKPFVGDYVQVLMHYRCHGVLDTGGGWTTEWRSARVTKVNQKTAKVLFTGTDFVVRVIPFDRIRPDKGGAS